jgi:hypothetical protein
MRTLGLLVLGLLGCSGCIVAADHPGYGGGATLTVDWTVDGTTDPAQCRQGDAASFDLIVETRAGDLVGEFEGNCEDFETSVDLPPGRYQASAVMLDSRGDDRTTQVDLEPFTLYGGDELILDVDFPARSFY